VFGQIDDQRDGASGRPAALAGGAGARHVRLDRMVTASV
jgi:hypothetical protein